MIRRLWRAVLTITAGAALCTPAASAQTTRTPLTVSSPNGALTVTVGVDGQLTWSVAAAGGPILSPSRLALTLEDGRVLGDKPVVTGTTTRRVDRELRPVVRYRRASVRDAFNERRIDFTGHYALVVRAFDDAVAYRWVTSIPGEITVRDEAATFAFTGDHQLYFPEETDLISHQERLYKTPKISEVKPGQFASLPALAVVPGGPKVAITESDLLDYPGMDLTVGDAPHTLRAYKHYIDFAADHGIEYVILDEGWYPLGDLLSVVPAMDMDALAAHARSRGVGLVMWVVWKTFDQQMEAALDRFEKWGVKGIKVDFMQREDQWMVNYYERVAKAAGKRRLLVDFHGSYKPTGLNRTYPNVLTSEGVVGLEHNKWGENASPDNAVTFPFLRMMAGPVDYTPGAMINAAKADFKPVFNRPMSQGTRCHQLAMYVVYESPLQMLADSPSNYRREPESLAFLSRVPAAWDETRILSAALGEHILVARRSGQDWYVGALTNWTARDIDVDLSFLGTGRFEAEIHRDGPNADRVGVDYVRDVRPANGGETLKIHLAPGGGFAARFTPAR